MPSSWCGKRLGWERSLQPSGSTAATQEPVRVATDMGMALSFFSTMSEKYTTIRTMGHIARGAGEGVMEPNGDSDRDVRKMDEGESPPKADEEMVCTDQREGTKEEDEPMQEGEQGEAEPTEDVNDKPATRSDRSVAVAEEGKSDEAPKTNTPNKEGLDATQKLWSLPPPQ